eukprot:3494599-Rhodomonas_salina.1
MHVTATRRVWYWRARNGTDMHVTTTRRAIRVLSNPHYRPTEFTPAGLPPRSFSLKWRCVALEWR